MQQEKVDSGSVQDRIRQWQAQGGGVVITDNKKVDGKVPVCDGLQTTREDESRTPSKRRARDSSGLKQNNGKSPKSHEPDLPRSQSQETPTKRVLSDGHWRTRRSSEKEKTPSKNTSLTEKPTLSNEGTISNDAPLENDEKTSQTLLEQEDLVSNRDSPVSAKYRTPHRPSDNSRRRASRDERDKHHKRKETRDSNVTPEDNLQSQRPRITSSQSQPRPDLVGSNPTHSRQSSLQTRAALKNLDEYNRGAFSESKGSLRSKKGNILSQVLGESKKIFMNQVPPPEITPRIPSIEQWLDGTPDPFIDADEPLEEEMDFKPLPRRKKTARPEDVNGEPARSKSISDSKKSGGNMSSGRRREKRDTSSTILEESTLQIDLETNKIRPDDSASTPNQSDIGEKSREPRESSASSLNRRGANRRGSSPIKERRKSRPAEDNTQDSLKTSDDSIETQYLPRRTSQSLESLKPPGLNIKRPFPSTGVRPLSTIASVSTLNFGSETTQVPAEPTKAKDQKPLPLLPEKIDPGGAEHQTNSKLLNRNNSRIAKHADLMSILSLPQGGGKSIKSARSIRTNRSRLDTATIPDLMKELATDETKYMRELRTLVDGVIPVLLTCVLSRSDSAVAAGLFQTKGGTHDPTFTKPIVDMGIALERLRTLHKRTPEGDHRAFLTWAHGAHRVYSEYLKVWRLGFQDVVVNLAPATDQASSKTAPTNTNGRAHEEDIPRNAEGDVTNGDGERVDVAFLLKRPLVRLKYLAKTLKGIHMIQRSVETESLSAKYQKLVDDARQRANEERSRLEDEAAADIDSTRARDPRTLAPVAGVVIDRMRHVRARDHFNLAFQHSNGQRVDCRTELLLRDEQNGGSAGGDLLVCEIGEAGRWLLLPPIRLDLVSARNGDLQGEMIVMVRGMGNNGQEWQEILSLQSEEESIAFEWVQMLGLHPIPPQIPRSQSFLNKRRPQAILPAPTSNPLDDSTSTQTNLPITKNRTPSPQDVEVPMGEQATEISKTWNEQDDDLKRGGKNSFSKTSSATAEDQESIVRESASTPPKSSRPSSGHVSDLHSLPSQTRNAKTVDSPRTPRTLKEALGLSGSSNPMGLKRSRAKRVSRHGDMSPRSRSSRHDSESPCSSPTSSDVQAPSYATNQDEKPPHSSEGLPPCTSSPEKPHTGNEASKVPSTSGRSPSSIPSKELPFIPKARKSSSTAMPLPSSEDEPVWTSAPSAQLPATPTKVTKKRPVTPRDKDTGQKMMGNTKTKGDELDLTKTPVLENSRARHRRSSSPLKHEYEPSTASDTSSDSDASTVAHHDDTLTSDSSDDEELEEGDAPTPLLPIGALKSLSRPNFPRRPHPATEGSIKPSDSASQAPYKKVPAQLTRACKTIASIFSWSDEGSWQSLHPDECSIVITPGLIEAFEMSAAHSHTKPLSSPVPVVDAEKFSDMASELTSQNDDVRGERPLVALELTPLVPLRRGTAIDISIRSPPTSNSQITSGNNIMFRSRSPEECEALYALINHSRIHNPTYIALQNARPYGGGSSFPGPVNRRGSSHMASSRSSWFGGWGRSSSYRASSKRASSVAQTESSIASMSSAFSALKRFSNRSGGGLFNIAKSTIGSRTGSQANSIYSSSDNSSGSGTSTPIPPGVIETRKEAPIGLSNAKIRLYIRETASRWRDMGSARLTIMQPERSLLGPDGRPSSSGGPPVTHEKRIVINGKTKGEVLLDEQLGESCFERVARTGIAVSVWEDVVGPNGEVGVVNAIGGVAGGKANVYMIQMKTEAETAFTFSLVGKLRY